VSARVQQRTDGVAAGVLALFHALALAGLLLPGPAWWWLAAGAVYCLVGVCTTLGLHRLLSHRAFTCPRWVEHALVSVAMVTGQGSPLLWVATHRRHHAHSDSEGDVHSPTRGFWYAHVGWILDPDSTDPEAWRTLCRDLAHDRYYHWLLRYRLVPQALAVVAVALCLGWAAVPRVFYLPVVLWMHTSYGVNSVCHSPRFGTRAFATPEGSRNVWWMALLSFGEGWHNNHHAFPRAAFHGMGRWQPDASGWVLRGLARLGLASQLQHPTPAVAQRLRLTQEAPPADAPGAPGAAA
jgi:stearoyl-CoA desaturase (delta-9 desaturase)